MQLYTGGNCLLTCYNYEELNGGDGDDIDADRRGININDGDMIEGRIDRVTCLRYK